MCVCLHEILVGIYIIGNHFIQLCVASVKHDISDVSETVIAFYCAELYWLHSSVTLSMRTEI